MKQRFIGALIICFLTALLGSLLFAPVQVYALTRSYFKSLHVNQVSYNAIEVRGAFVIYSDSHVSEAGIQIKRNVSMALIKTVKVDPNDYNSFSVILPNLSDEGEYIIWAYMKYDNGMATRYSKDEIGEEFFKITVSTNPLPDLNLQSISEIKLTSALYSLYLDPNGSLLTQFGIKVYKTSDSSLVLDKVLKTGVSVTTQISYTIADLKSGTEYYLEPFVIAFDGNTHTYAVFNFKTDGLVIRPSIHPSVSPTLSPMPTPTPTPSPTPSPTRTPTPSPTPSPTPKISPTLAGTTATTAASGTTASTASSATTTSTAATGSETAATMDVTTTVSSETTISSETSLGTGASESGNPTSSQSQALETIGTTDPDDQGNSGGSNTILIILLSLIGAALIGIFTLMLIRGRKP